MQIEFTPEFKRNLRMLARKYRSIRMDIQPVIEQLQKGIIIGDQIPEMGLLIFKVRALNRDIQKGKRSGYRLIYYKKTRIKIVLVTVYSKLDQSDISSKEIKDIVQGFEEL
ncbi:MAG: type II toxin-antitoxin system RelE/ParE family toxin [Candidatus Desantisbacteria bacterium]